jgi:hypothetical protein
VHTGAEKESEREREREREKREGEVLRGRSCMVRGVRRSAHRCRERETERLDCKRMQAMPVASTPKRQREAEIEDVRVREREG